MISGQNCTVLPSKYKVQTNNLGPPLALWESRKTNVSTAVNTNYMLELRIKHESTQGRDDSLQILAWFDHASSVKSFSKAFLPPRPTLLLYLRGALQKLLVYQGAQELKVSCLRHFKNIFFFLLKKERDKLRVERIINFRCFIFKIEEKRVLTEAKSHQIYFNQKVIHFLSSEIRTMGEI